MSTGYGIIGIIGNTMKELAELYNKAFPNYPPLAYTDRWVYGVWMIGNDYRNKTTFYGAYPARYLNRIMSMFPNTKKIMHLFSGSVPKGNYIRFDLVQEADVEGDAHSLSKYFEPESFDLILADPPYTDQDAERYGTPMVNRNIVVKECYKVLKPTGHLVWLDCVLPMYSKEQFSLIGTIGLVRSTNHRFRVVSIFRKAGTEL